MEPYPSGQFGFIDDPDRQFRNGSVWTRTRTRSDGPEPLLTLQVTRQWSGLRPAILFGPVPDLAKNLTRFILVGLLPGPDKSTRIFGCVEPPRRFHFKVPATLAALKYLSPDCTMT